MPVTSAVMITFPLSKLCCGNCVYLSISVSDFYYSKMEIHFWAKLRLWMLRSHLEEDKKAERGHLFWQLHGFSFFCPPSPPPHLTQFYWSVTDCFIFLWEKNCSPRLSIVSRFLCGPYWSSGDMFSLFIHSDTYEFNHIWAHTVLLGLCMCSGNWLSYH